MEKLTFGNVVGFVLAVLFALVIGVSMWALLAGDYMNSFMNEQTRHTLRIVGFAGALAALVTWWVQSFAAKRGFIVRFMFAFFIFVVAFCSFGGLLRFIYIHATYPESAGLDADRACISPRSTTSTHSCWICCCRRARLMPLSPWLLRSLSPGSGRARPGPPTSDCRSDLSGGGRSARG